MENQEVLKTLNNIYEELDISIAEIEEESNVPETNIENLYWILQEFGDIISDIRSS